MIILIDNYDSFSANVYQLLGDIYPDIHVVRNDAISIQDIKELDPISIVLSPGPGRPSHAGICEDIVREFSGSIPLLGICLGHQAICEVMGANIIHSPQIMHGKSSEVSLDTSSKLFTGMPATCRVGRYHSLEADPNTLPPTLRITARTQSGEIMAVEHTAHPTYGVQFHPESVLTPHGSIICHNFIDICKGASHD